LNLVTRKISLVAYLGRKCKEKNRPSGERKRGEVLEVGWIDFLYFLLGWIISLSFTFIFHLEIIQKCYLSLKMYSKDLKVGKMKDKNSYKV